MSNRFITTLVMLFGGATVVPGFVAIGLAADLDGYDCSFQLSEGLESIRSVTLSENVYRCFKFANYADLGVMNADQQIVPFKLSRPAVDINRKRYTKDITFYQEPQASSYRTGDQIRRIAALTGVVSSNISDKQWQLSNVHYSSVILEQASLESDQLLSVALAISTSEEPIRATVLVEVSNDLQNWKTLSKPHNFYFLPGKGTSLNKSSLKLSRYRNSDARYFRLATLSNVEAFTTLIDRVSGTFQQTSFTSEPMQWVTAEPYKIDDEDGAWQFDLPSLVPVSTVRLSNADNIVYYQGRILSEPHANPKVENENIKKSGKKKLKEAIKNAAKGMSRKTNTSVRWRTVSRFSRYKLISEDGSFESPDVEFANVKSRSWKIKFNVPADLRADQLPRIELGWIPSKVNFIAQGEGPFTLVAGRNDVTKKVAFPAQLQNLVASAEQVNLVDTMKLDTTKRVLTESGNPGSGSIGSKDLNWKKFLLWAILLLGISLMFYMAYSLMRSMKKDS